MVCRPRQTTAAAAAAVKRASEHRLHRVTVDDMAMAINDRRVRILQTVLIMRHCELQVEALRVYSRKP